MLFVSQQPRTRSWSHNTVDCSGHDSHELSCPLSSRWCGVQLYLYSHVCIIRSHCNCHCFTLAICGNVRGDMLASVTPVLPSVTPVPVMTLSSDTCYVTPFMYQTGVLGEYLKLFTRNQSDVQKA